MARTGTRAEQRERTDPKNRALRPCHEQYQRCVGTLAVMREHGIQMRYDDDKHVMVWKPKPEKWPLSLSHEMHMLAHDLIALLVPAKSPFAERRAGWTTGPLGACVGCGSSTALYDPLGQPRHTSCGYLGQSESRAPIQHSASQRKMRQQG